MYYCQKCDCDFEETEVQKMIVSGHTAYICKSCNGPCFPGESENKVTKFIEEIREEQLRPPSPASLFFVTPVYPSPNLGNLDNYFSENKSYLIQVCLWILSLTFLSTLFLKFGDPKASSMYMFYITFWSLGGSLYFPESVSFIGAYCRVLCMLGIGTLILSWITRIASKIGEGEAPFMTLFSGFVILDTGVFFYNTVFAAVFAFVFHFSADSALVLRMIMNIVYLMVVLAVIKQLFFCGWQAAVIMWLSRLAIIILLNQLLTFVPLMLIPTPSLRDISAKEMMMNTSDASSLPVDDTAMILEDIKQTYQ